MHLLAGFPGEPDATAPRPNPADRDDDKWRQVAFNPNGDRIPSDGSTDRGRRGHGDHVEALRFTDVIR